MKRFIYLFFLFSIETEIWYNVLRTSKGEYNGLSDTKINSDSEQKNVLYCIVLYCIVLYLFSVQNIHEKDTEHCQHSAYR
jgi:hypothetical protein